MALDGVGHTPPALAETSFDDPELLDILEASALHDLDELTFGLIVMSRDGIVIAYNANESRRAGLARHRVLEHHFFHDVGPCMNNYLVAERYHEGGDLDEQLDYVLTFRMAPTPVRLRLLARADSPRTYLAIRPR